MEEMLLTRPAACEGGATNCAREAPVVPGRRGAGVVVGAGCATGNRGRADCASHSLAALRFGVGRRHQGRGLWFKPLHSNRKGRSPRCALQDRERVDRTSRQVLSCRRVMPIRHAKNRSNACLLPWATKRSGRVMPASCATATRRSVIWWQRGARPIDVPATRDDLRSVNAGRGICAHRQPGHCCHRCCHA